MPAAEDEARMRTVHWQLNFDGLVLSQESYTWTAGVEFVQHEDNFNLQQAGIRRPVRARLARPANAKQRFGRVALTPVNSDTPIETVGVEVDFPVRKFEFDASWLSAQLPVSLDFDFRQASAQPTFDEPSVTATLDRIYDELMVPRPDSAPLLKSLIQVLAIDTARCLIARSSQDDRSLRSLSPEQVARIRHLIQTTGFKDLTLTNVADRLGMRQPRLREMFRRATGTSLREEIHDARVYAACRRLVETDDPLKVVAHELGFRHASAFCYWFKQCTGLTPTEHRNRRLWNRAEPLSGLIIH